MELALITSRLCHGNGTAGPEVGSMENETALDFSTPKPRNELVLQGAKNVVYLFPAPTPRFFLLIETNASICVIHRLANSSSVKRFADLRARNLTALGLGSDSAFSKPSANSVDVVAWNPIKFQVEISISCQILAIIEAG